LSSKQKRGKNSAQRTALFCSKTNKSFARRSKIQKNSNEFTTEVKPEKIQKKKSVGERNTLCRTDFVTAHLSNVLAYERAFLFETRTTRTRLFQRRRRWW
jgi:3-deoxy-D-arabino-heptulosonate 7-phosphate (DAHP) synthase class II